MWFFFTWIFSTHETVFVSRSCSSWWIIASSYTRICCDLQFVVPLYLQSLSIMKFYDSRTFRLMTWSGRDFDNGGGRWRRRWNYQIFNGTHVIVNLDKWLFRIFETTLGSGNWLHIEARFHFNRNICECLQNTEMRKHEREKKRK